MATGVLLIVVGVWLLLQTMVGDLPRRILSWGPGLARVDTTGLEGGALIETPDPGGDAGGGSVGAD